MKDLLESFTDDLSDMAGEITEGSICGAIGAGTTAVSGVAIAGTTGSAPLAIGGGLAIGVTAYKACKKYGLDDDIRDLLNK
ncbi:hypothetical protein [Aestuariibacter salexigens]|uniref:hypothetical protein n=1 Tax=Aestuariibacter salexigens TaxID=226010 RepID=UPI0012EC8461|nr:hypothetical protein [Aestuariibacter salexigens]